MRALVQRVSDASVIVGGHCVAKISSGLLVFLGIKNTDTDRHATKLVKQITHLRIFADQNGKMNLSALEQSKELLIVSQFTLYGELRDGNRPSYVYAAKPEIAEPLYNFFVELCRATGLRVDTGVFRAHMEVRLTNEGPVSFLCESE